MGPNQLEEYLDELERQLPHRTTAERREWRAEGLSHLRALAEAEEELGATREDAELAATRRFGRVHEIGGLLRASDQHQQRRTLQQRLAGVAHGQILVVGANLLVVRGLMRLTAMTDLLGARPTFWSAFSFVPWVVGGHALAGWLLGKKLGWRAYLQYGAAPQLVALLLFLWGSGAFDVPVPFMAALLSGNLLGAAVGFAAARVADERNQAATEQRGRPAPRL